MLKILVVVFFVLSSFMWSTVKVASDADAKQRKITGSGDKL